MRKFKERLILKKCRKSVLHSPLSDMLLLIALKNERHIPMRYLSREVTARKAGAVFLYARMENKKQRSQ